MAPGEQFPFALPALLWARAGRAHGTQHAIEKRVDVVLVEENKADRIRRQQALVGQQVTVRDVFQAAEAVQPVLQLKRRLGSGLGGGTLHLRKVATIGASCRFTQRLVAVNLLTAPLMEQ